MTERRREGPAAPRFKALCMAAVLAAAALSPMGGGSAEAADQTSARDAQALRRACATGALTPYVCALRGVKTTPPTAPAAAEAAQADKAATPPTPPSSSPGAPPKTPAPKTNDTRSADQRSLKDPAGRYRLEAPRGWTGRMEGSEAALAKGDDWIVVRGMTRLPSRFAVTAALNLLRDQYASFKVTSQGTTSVGGRDAETATAQAVTKAGRPAAILVVIAPISSGDSLVIMGGGAPGDAQDVASAVGALTSSLKFL